MKKVIIALLVCLPAMFVSCDDHNPNNDRFGSKSESGWVEFTSDSSATITGSQLNIPVQLKTVQLYDFLENTPVNKNGFEVFYDVTPVTGSAEGISFSGSSTIPAGQASGDIVIDIPQSSSNSCSGYIVELRSTSKSDVSVGLDETSITKHYVKIGGNRDAFVGSYNVIEDGQYNYVVTVTAGSAPNELIISNLYDQSAQSQTRVFLDAGNSGSNIRFADSSLNLLFTSSNATQGDFFVSTDFEDYFEDDGETPRTFVPSFYDPCTKNITLNFILIYGEGQNTATPTINVVMNKI